MIGLGLDAMPQFVAVFILVMLGIVVVGLAVLTIVNRVIEHDELRDALLQDDYIRAAAASRPPAGQQQPRD